MKSLVFLLLGLLSSSVSAFGQCFIRNVGSIGQLYESTGDEEIDAKLRSYKADLEELFGVHAELYIYDDSEAPNALASPCDGEAQCDGIIAFGNTLLLSQLWRADQGEYAVAGVLAHEFAHVLQFVYENELPTKLQELHADFLAGYYIGKRRLLSEGIDNFAKALFELGDYEFWDPSHHGTPQERVTAMMAGFLAGLGNFSVDEAYAEGVRHVETLAKYSDYEICDRCNRKG